MTAWLSDGEERRFNDKFVDFGPGECWPWVGAQTGQGYGAISIRGRMWLAHRVAWSVTNGEIPDGLCVLHSCDNPECVNPEHLRVGTPLDNANDCISRGRRPRGEEHGRSVRARPRGDSHYGSKLSQAVVAELRKLHAAGELNQRARAREMGLAQSTVRRAAIGISWAHVDATNGGGA